MTGYGDLYNVPNNKVTVRWGVAQRGKKRENERERQTDEKHTLKKKNSE